ncbi:MAG: ATP-binding protein [Bacteroidales bacterium]|nr:ATP-binding protein [Bacteroidales bacterium]
MELAIISGKGGTGKSSIAAAFATMGSNVILADCDVDAANLYLLFNPPHDEEEVFTGSYKAVVDQENCTLCRQCIDYCRFDAIAMVNNQINISEASCDGCFLCSRICPEQAIEMIQHDKSRMYTGSFRDGRMVYGWLAPGEENSGKLVNLIREKVKKLAQQNGLSHIIIDGPPGTGCPVISTITGTDKVLIVTEPGISGLSDLKRTVELVQGFKYPAMVLINKYDLNPEMTSRIEVFCDTVWIPVVGKLAFDPQMTEAMLNCKSIVEWKPKSETSKALNRIWKTILNF